ncbi:MAG: sodium/solute symporter [Lentisphaerae bacterium]|nr:sodium/solute symporter [Lentisphaerota bacterium]
MDTLTLIDNVVLVAYVVLMLGMGVFFARGQKDEKDYLLGGGKVHWILLGASFVATSFSGVSFAGIPGYLFKYDPRVAIQSLGALLGIPVVLLLVPRLHALKTLSAYEFLEQRYHISLRFLASGLWIAAKMTWISVALYAAGLVLTESAGIPLTPSIVLIGSAVTLLTMMGGLKGVVWTDAIQAVIMISGMALVAWYAVRLSGEDVAALWQTASGDGKTWFFDFRFSMREPVFWICITMPIVQSSGGVMSDQLMIQRFSSADSASSARKSFVFFMLVVVGFTWLMYFLSIMLYGFYHGGAHALPPEVRANPDRALAHFVMSVLPVGIRGLLIASIIAATASTATSILNSSCALTMADFYDKYLGRNDSPRKRVIVSRIVTVGWGLFAILFAANFKRMTALGIVGEATPKLAGLLGSGIAGIFMLGHFFPRVNAAGAVAGLLAGTGTVAWFMFGTDVHFLWYFPSGFAVTLLAGYAASLAFGRGQRKGEHHERKRV